MCGKTDTKSKWVKELVMWQMKTISMINHRNLASTTHIHQRFTFFVVKMKLLRNSSGFLLLGVTNITLMLKVVSATFFLVFFVSLKESTFETRKNVSYFTSKALFTLELIEFWLFRYSNVMTSKCLRMKHETHFTE